MKMHFLLFLLLICISCGQHSDPVIAADQSEATAMAFNSSTAANTPADPQTLFSEKIEQGVIYRVRMIPALEFIARRGKPVAESDRGELSNTSVLLLELELSDVNKDIWESPQLKLEKDDARNYLVGAISNDLYISQNGLDITPTGVNFEGSSGAANKIRAVFFLEDIDINKPLTVSYYDQLFGAGLLKFGIHQPTNHQ
jgi:hypothetical protein